MPDQTVDPDVAREVVERRYGIVDHEAIAPEDWVESNLGLAASGLTHDEELLRLYEEAIADG